MNYSTYTKRRFISATIVCLTLVLSSANPVLAHSLDHEHDKKLEQKKQQTELEARPVNLSQAELIQRYSLTGDDTLLIQGWQQLEPRLSGKVLDVADLLHAAWLSQADHNFSKALNYLHQVIEIRPNNAQAWLLKSSIHTVLNERDQARSACKKLSLTVSISAATACAGRLANSHVEKELAYSRLQKFMQLETANELTPWIQSVAADLAFSLGKTAHAEQLYRSSIDSFPSVQARAALADLLLDDNRANEVTLLISDEDTTPALQIRRLIAKQNLGIDVNEEISSVDVLFRQWAQDGDFRHAREMAKFYLYLRPDPQLAKFLAQKNYAFQREPEDQELLELTASPSAI